MGLYKRFAFRGMIAGLLTAAAIFSLNVLATPKPVAATDSGDCGISSIIKCGVRDVSEILAKFDSDAVVRGTYQNFRSASTPNGITRDMLVKLVDANMAGPQGLVYDTWLGGARDVVTRTDGFPIANNAMTAGRVNVSGSTVLGTFGGVTVYQRPYRLSNQGTKQAFILMDGKKFVFGILAECGNPVTADTPSISQNKEISKDNTNFVENVAFKDGETAYFRITVHETSGKAGASNVMVTDALPAGFSIMAGTTKLNGATIADVSSDPINIGLLGVGATSTVTFQATAHIVGESCGTSHIVNTSSVSSDQSNSISDTASGDVSKDCPVIVAKCDSLTGLDTLTEGDTSDYTANATAQNTTVTSIAFSVDGTEVQNGTASSYTYTASSGSHVISAVVTFANGTQSGGANCSKTITVNPVPKTVSCTALNGPATLNVNESGSYTVVTSDNSLVETYNFFLDNAKVGESTNPTSSISIGTTGSHTFSVIIVPKAGVNAGTPNTCEKTITVNELPKFVICTGIEGPGSLSIGQTATYSALSDNDDRVASYAWEGVTSSTGKTATISFDQAGNHTIKVTLTPKTGVNGGTPVTCEKVITVTSSSPIYSCDLLKLNPTTVKTGQKVTATITFTAKNGAVFKSAVVNFGEASVGVDSASANSFTADYVYKKAKTYDVTASVTFTINDETIATDTGCTAKITVTTPPAVLGTSTKLANTGPEGMLGVFILTTFVGTILHHLYIVRRPY